MAGLILVIMIVSTACADDSDERTFANDPRTAVAEPTELATPSSSFTPVMPQDLPSPEAMVQRRGAPDTIYSYFAGALRSVTAETVQVVVDADVLAYAASPSGDNVAVVNPADTTGGEMSYSVSIHAPDGDVIDTFENVLRVASDAATPVNAATPIAAATPVSGDGPGPSEVDLSWVGQDDRLLLTHSSGALIDIPLDGEPRPIDVASSIEGIFQAAWSPQGDSIGVLMRDEAGNGELALLDTASEPATATVIAPQGASDGDERSVESFAWKANGSGVYFLEMSRTERGLQGGAVLTWDEAANSTTIVATGAQDGPSGSVTSFSASPDGDAVMYQVALPTGDGLSFNGLYVRSLESGQVYRAPVSPDVSVMDAWWFVDGVVWIQVGASEGEQAPVDIVLVDRSGAQSLLASSSLAPSGSPVASPVGDATPVGSPVATPLASPTP